MSIFFPLFSRRLTAAWLFAIAGCFLPAANASSVVPMYLDQLIDDSAVAFEGVWTGNRTERDPATGFIVTYTTFDVRDALKGAVGSRYVIKQVGGTLPGGPQYRVEGVPSFTPGNDYVVFLAGVSSSGFSSPLGLEQGRFKVTVTPGGSRVGNGRDFKAMAGRMSSHLPPAERARLERAPGAVRDMDLESFKQSVRNHLAAVPR